MSVTEPMHSTAAQGRLRESKLAQTDWRKHVHTFQALRSAGPSACVAAASADSASASAARTPPPPSAAATMATPGGLATGVLMAVQSRCSLITASPGSNSFRRSQAAASASLERLSMESTMPAPSTWSLQPQGMGSQQEHARGIDGCTALPLLPAAMVPSSKSRAAAHWRRPC